MAVANVPSFLPRTIDAPRDGQCRVPQILSRTLAAPSSGTSHRSSLLLRSWDSLLITVQRGSASLTFDLERVHSALLLTIVRRITNRLQTGVRCESEVFRRKATGELLAECSATDTAEFKREV